MDQLQYILICDYGGTKHSAALLPLRWNEWLAVERVQAPPGADADCDQELMNNLALQLLQAHPGTLLAIGVSFGGPVDFGSGTVRLSHHVPGWENVPLRDKLEKRFGVPAVIDNDANMAALGEWSHGAGKGADSLLYVTISTGIGGGWILNGRIFRGFDGMAGEIGHMVIHPGGALCDCTKRGCLEAEACGRAIGRKASQWLREGRQAPRLLEKSGGNPAGISAAMVAEAAREQEEFSRNLLDEAASFLGQGLATAINLINPECIVLGGGVTKAGPFYWQTVRRTTQENVLAPMRVDIRPAALGDDAPLWGAATMAEQMVEELPSIKL